MFSFRKCRNFAGLAALCLLFTAGSGHAQIHLPPATPPGPVSALEYFIDADPGFGMGTSIAITPGMDVTAAPIVPTAGLAPGIHRVYLRAKNAAGVWGLTNLRLLYVAPHFSFATSAPADVTALEYFFDTDPGFGLATPLSVVAGQDVSFTGSIATSGLSAGVHYFGVRAKNSKEAWGLTNLKPVYVLPSISLPAAPSAAPIVAAEYFVDEDPGFGLGTPLPIAPGLNVTVPGYIAPIGSLSAGVHQVVIRFQDANGNWSLSNSSKLTVIVATLDLPTPAPAQPFTTLEYFFDNDPGMGNGTLLTVPATTHLSGFELTASLAGLAEGSHVLYLRTVAPWSLTSFRMFEIGDPLPVTLVTFSASKLKSAVRLQWETAQEQENMGFVLERSGDGQRFDSLTFVPAAGGLVAGHSYAFTDLKPLPGPSFYRLRQLDVDGSIHYSPVAAVSFDTPAQGAFTCNNPVAEALKIFNSSGAAAQYQIHDLQGRQVAAFTGSGGPVDIFQATQLPAGSYLLLIRQGEGRYTLRFQKH